MTYIPPRHEIGGAAARDGGPCIISAGEAAEASFLAPDDLPDWVRAEWDKLPSHAAEPNPFAERWFVEPGITAYHHKVRLRIAVVADAAGVIGLMPLALRRRLSRIPAPNTSNWNQPDAFLGTPLVRRGKEEAFWQAIIAGLDRADWAPGFLHVSEIAEDGTVHRGLAAAARRLGRPAPVVQRFARALLDSDLSSADYYARTVRPKKRKELKRLAARLGELGQLSYRELDDPAALPEWCEAFLDLERSGWKGQANSAMACYADGGESFRAAMAGAMAAGRLQMLRMELDGRPLAMLVNFLVPPGGFMFKTAFDEEYGRFSPGVLIQLHNYRILDRSDIAWMDSCATAHHPMIDSLWGERRSIVRLSVPLAGIGRRTVFSLYRTVERAAAATRRMIA